MIEITFLGTTCMIPTKERNHISNFISYKNEGILVDCGEGTQRQLKIAGIKFSKITKILISHWHGDHVLGLPGLLQSMSASDYNRKLKIYGLKGTKKYINNMIKSFGFDNRVDFEVFDVSEGIFFQNALFKLKAMELEHNIPTIGFRFIENDRRRINVQKIKKLGIPEGPKLGQLQKGHSIMLKGKKIEPRDVTYVVKGKHIGIITDTVLTKNCYALAKDADLLICEAAYSSKLEEKALEYKHMTAKQAALIASQSNVKELILTHFSARYKDTTEIEEDAKDVFQNVRCAYDFMKTKL